MPEEKIPHPSAPKRTKPQMEADIAEVSRLALKGMTNREIAEELGKTRPYRLSHVTISKDLLKAKEKWRQASVQSIDEIRTRELAGLELQEREAWLEWERSKRDKEVKRSKLKNGGATGTTNEASKATSGQCGDPAYMRLILEIRDRRAAMLGLNAATKTELTGAGGGPLAIEAEYDIEHLMEFAIQLGREKESNPAGSEERQGETV